MSITFIYDTQIFFARQQRLEIFTQKIGDLRSMMYSTHVALQMQRLTNRPRLQSYHCNHKEKHYLLLIAIEFAEKTQLCSIAIEK